MRILNHRESCITVPTFQIAVHTLAILDNMTEKRHPHPPSKTQGLPVRPLLNKVNISDTTMTTI